MKPLSDPSETGARVAVVEEGAENIYSIRFILQSLGYDVASFSGGRDFLVRLAEFKPSVVLVDMLMPAETGLRVLMALRERRSDLRVLAVTADAVPWTEEQLRSAGADDVLTKPYDVSDLQRVLSGS
jgi:CheY-like chemotaxis protein